MENKEIRKETVERKISTPLTYEKIKDLKAGDTILLTGTIYSARDAAHKRLIDLLDSGHDLPINIKGEAIYYVGPRVQQKKDKL